MRRDDRRRLKFVARADATSPVPIAKLQEARSRRRVCRVCPAFSQSGAAEKRFGGGGGRATVVGSRGEADGIALKQARRIIMDGDRVLGCGWCNTSKRSRVVTKSDSRCVLRLLVLHTLAPPNPALASWKSIHTLAGLIGRKSARVAIVIIIISNSNSIIVMKNRGEKWVFSPAPSHVVGWIL